MEFYITATGFRQPTSKAVPDRNTGEDAGAALENDEVRQEARDYCKMVQLKPYYTSTFPPLHSELRLSQVGEVRCC